jgi:hypothetical protein
LPLSCRSRLGSYLLSTLTFVVAAWGMPIGTPGEKAYVIVYAVGEAAASHIVLVAAALAAMLVLASVEGPRQSFGGVAYRLALASVLLSMGSSVALVLFMARGLSAQLDPPDESPHRSTAEGPANEQLHLTTARPPYGRLAVRR